MTIGAVRVLNLANGQAQTETEMCAVSGVARQYWPSSRFAALPHVSLPSQQFCFGQKRCRKSKRISPLVSCLLFVCAFTVYGQCRGTTRLSVL